MEKGIQYISHEGRLYAIIIRNNFHSEGIKFLTEDGFSQQLAYMQHKKNKIIDAHVHNHEERNVVQTQEVLFIRKGILRCDFYTSEEYKYFVSVNLYSGDVILLAYGGHGFKVIEDVEMIEVKQGPFLGEKDKKRFIGIDDGDVQMNGDDVYE